MSSETIRQHFKQLEDQRLLRNVCVIGICSPVHVRSSAGVENLQINDDNGTRCVHNPKE